MDREMKAIKLLSIFIIFTIICAVTLANNNSKGTKSTNNPNSEHNTNGSTIFITLNENNNNNNNNNNSKGYLNQHKYLQLSPSSITYNYSYLVDKDHLEYNTNGSQRNRRDSVVALDSSEIARQNQITEQILTNYLERHLFPFTNVNRKIPTIAEILPKPKTTRSSYSSRGRSITETSPTYRRGLANSASRGKLYNELRGKKSNSRRNGQRKRQRQRHSRKHRKNKQTIPDVVDQNVEKEVAEVVTDEVTNVTDNDDSELKQDEEHEEEIDVLTEMPHTAKMNCNTFAQLKGRINCSNYGNDRFEGYYLPESSIDHDNNEALQSVESSQYDHYFHNHHDNDADNNEGGNNTDMQHDDDDNDILKRDPKENEIDNWAADCPNCVDDTQYMNKWTMPLLKLGEKRYYLGIFFKANWFKATQYCRYHGMHLASISSQEENDRLEKHIRDYGLGHEHFWTSGTDLADEGNFFWMSTGRPITFTNWNAGEPNNFRYENGEEENCLELWNRDGKGLKWNDSPCSFETYFVCEVQPN